MRVVSLGVVLLLVVSAAGGAARGAEPARPAEPLAEKGAAKKRISDTQIRKVLIDESIAGYDGNLSVSV